MKTFYELIDVNDYEILSDEKMVAKILFLKMIVFFSSQVVLFLSNGRYSQSNPRLTYKSTYTP